MIRYEYEEEDLFPDHKMPIVRNAEMNTQQLPSEPYFPEADWLNSDTPIDDFARQFNAETFDELDIEGVFDDLQPNHMDNHQFNDSLFDSHHTSYYSNTTGEEEQLQTDSCIGNIQPFHQDYYQNHHRQDVQPLRSRDLNIPQQSGQGKKRVQSGIKKPNKPPSQRRPIDEFPTKNGFKKPLFSYSCLIGLSLRNSETEELTVAEIYRFLCEHFPFFREAPSGWKNSVRHNLSLNKCFQKVEVTVPDAQGRRSCLWRINPAKLERMASEINKWRERCAPTISLAMDNPNDLDDIINGKKGMPPADDLYASGRDEENDLFPGQRSKERVIYISRMQDLNKLERHRAIDTRQFNSVPSHSKYLVRQPLRAIKQEPEHYYRDENSLHSLPSTSAHYSNFASSSRYTLQSSVHERAARNLESLLELKKHATVHPREGSLVAADDEEDQENCSPQRLQNTPLRPSNFQSPSSSRSSKPMAIRLQRPSLHSLNSSDSPVFHRQDSRSPAPFSNIRPPSIQ